MSQARHWPPTVNGHPVPYGHPIDELGQMLGDMEQAKTASIALARVGSRESLRLLASLLDDRSRDWRRRRIGLDAIAMHPLGRTKAAQVLAMLNDPAPEVVHGAAEAAGSLGLTEAVPQLLDLLQRPEIPLWTGAHNALLKIQQPGDIDTLIGLYQSGDYEGRKRIGVLLYARIRRDSWQRLFDLFKASDVDQDREVAARIAHEFGDGAVLPDLETLTHDHNGHVRGAAARAISAIQDRRGKAGTGPRDSSIPLWPANLGKGL